MRLKPGQAAAAYLDLREGSGKLGIHWFREIHRGGSLIAERDLDPDLNLNLNLSRGLELWMDRRDGEAKRSWRGGSEVGHEERAPATTTTAVPPAQTAPLSLLSLNPSVS